MTLRTRRSLLVFLVPLLGVGLLAPDGRSGPGGLQVADEAAIADAIEKNGEIFKGWEPPRLALLLTGRMNGYLEPCGCAGLENQKGGLKRRHTLIRLLRDQRAWPMVSLDAGGLVRRLGPQAEIKYRYGIESLIELGYAGVGLGERDLLLSADSLLFTLANLGRSSPLISSNVGIYSMDNEFTKTTRVISSGGMQVGVTAVLGKQQCDDFADIDEVVCLEPLVGLSRAAKELNNQKCDYQVLLAHTSLEEAEELARAFPQFDFVVTTGGAEEPAPEARPIDGSRSLLIETGQKGMYAIVLGLYGKGQPIRYQRVPLDHRFDDSPEMHEKLINYQKELENLKLGGLGLLGTTQKGLAHPRGEFAGTDACADCHTEAMAAFEKTPHAHALTTLVELDPPRHYDPECLSCHVTGWDPQGYFPYASGYLGLDETPRMHHNGCENCHGPGAAHVAAENGEGDYTEAQVEALREALHMEIVENEGNKIDRGEVLGKVVNNCLECHDLDNSPDFDFKEYWPHVEHSGKY